MHLLGTLHAIKGVFEDSGFIVFNLPDGDKVYATWKGTGNLGKDAKGTITYVGGTGKYAGLTGGGEYTRRHVPNASKNVWAAITIHKRNWKLPYRRPAAKTRLNKSFIKLRRDLSLFLDKL